MGWGRPGTPAQMGFRRVLEAVWKVGSGLPGFHCRWKVAPPKIKSFDEQDATLLLGMPPKQDLKDEVVHLMNSII